MEDKCFRCAAQSVSQFLNTHDFGTVKWALSQIPCSFKENVAAAMADPRQAQKGELCRAGD
jgi:hypothetical protein